MAKIDLSDIKENDLDKTSTFKDLLSRSERKKYNSEKETSKDNNDIIDMLEEKKRSPKELKEETENYKEPVKEETHKDIKKDEDLGKTQLLELTRQMKFNFEDNIKEEKKKGYNFITDIGVFILIALAYFIYALLFTSYLDNSLFLLVDGAIILFMFVLFGVTMLTTKKNNKIFAIFNFIVLLAYIAFNILCIFKIIK